MTTTPTPEPDGLDHDRLQRVGMNADLLFHVHDREDVRLVMLAARVAMTRLHDLLVAEIEDAVEEGDGERAVVLSWSHGLYAAALAQIEGIDMPIVETDE